MKSKEWFILHTLINILLEELIIKFNGKFYQIYLNFIEHWTHVTLHDKENALPRKNAS